MILGIFYMVIKFEHWSQILFGYIPSLSWFYHPIFIYSIEVQARLRSYTHAHTTHTQTGAEAPSEACAQVHCTQYMYV